MPDSQTIHPLCSLHGERLARIEAKIDDLNTKVGVQNGRVSKTEDKIQSIVVKQGAHDVIQTSIMQKLIPIEESMGKMKDWRAGVMGGADSTAKLIREWVVVVGLLFTLAGIAISLWQGSMQRDALMVQIQQIKAAQAASK